MPLVEGAGDLNGGLEGLVEGQRAVLQSRGERLPFQVLHDEEVDPILVADVMESANVGMVQGRNGAGSPLEPFAQIRISGDLRREGPDRDGPIQSRVVCL